MQMWFVCDVSLHFFHKSSKKPFEFWPNKIKVLDNIAHQFADATKQKQGVKDNTSVIVDLYLVLKFYGFPLDFRNVSRTYVFFW